MAARVPDGPPLRLSFRLLAAGSSFGLRMYVPAVREPSFGTLWLFPDSICLLPFLRFVTEIPCAASCRKIRPAAVLTIRQGTQRLPRSLTLCTKHDGGEKGRFRAGGYRSVSGFRAAAGYRRGCLPGEVERPKSSCRNGSANERGRFPAP